MKYIEPASLSEALEILSADDEARCLAGGATLVAMLNANLVEPSTLIGLRRIDELAGITVSGDHIRVGAMTTHTQIAADDRLSGNAAVVRDAAGQIAHPAVRNMGTIGGAVCHADPNADFPGALVAADAVLEAVGSSGARQIPAGEFFLDYLETSLEEDEILSAVLVPVEPADARGRHLKFSRTHGDYATISVSLVLVVDGDACSYARVAVGSAGPAPIHLDEADSLLTGSALTPEVIRQAGRKLMEAADPVDDVRGSAEYRRMIIPGLLQRAVDEALP
ncbi:MAG: xanthine dehydrogenase family protein subunit M [Gammaproteobacteria bacterium]|nr:xanthine dehydrogenase family protein subunit M [Gammaproteobacteria bacterium]MDE0511634.1 xanthine dehydrogenase family protein subunit M [Gammaproteobacteria bacterium]